MSPCFNHFFIVLCFVDIAIPSFAIYDPRVTTTKPPERRESVLPWHSNDKENISRIQTGSRSSQWEQSQNNASSKPGGKSWTSWHKAGDSGIEHRTQIDTSDDISEQSSEETFDQERDVSFDKFEQQENLRSPSECGELTESDKNRGRFKDQSKYGRCGRPQNEIDFEHKQSPRIDSSTTETHAQYENDDLYEGVAVDSTKPRKENILLLQTPQHKVALYDSQLGVQCPTQDATGQFVYPPDCKFFVNCWNGRAFVQPCAPGTLFNPDTLECDFPHKVKCYERESASLREPLNYESQVRKDQDPQRLQEPKCPPYLTGLLPHHGDCTKFVQCANGATYIMDCGPGTVFNPAIGVCDWPRNVKGCEDTFKSNEEERILTPPYPIFGHDKSEYTEIKKIACPVDFAGLLPHPETCKKFLQCANGATYIMDCGPGTAFNPITTVCDWPHNVPSCKTDEHKSSDTIHRTESKTWSLPYSTTIRSSRPTWRPLTTTLSPRLSSTRTIMPPYFQSTTYPHPITYHDRYDRFRQENRHKDHSPHYPRWEPGHEHSGLPTDSTRKFPDYPNNRQQTGKQGTDQDPQGTYHFEHTEGSWPPEHGKQDHERDPEYYPPGQHYHHHYHHHHYHGSSTNPPTDSNWSSDSPATTGDRRYNKGFHPGYIPNVGDTRWYPDRNHHHSSHQDGYHHSGHPAPAEIDQRQLQPHFPPGSHKDNAYDVHNDTKYGANGNLPANQWIGYGFFPNRQNYGRTNPGFYHPSINRTSPSAGNVFLNSTDKFIGGQHRTQDESRQDRGPSSWLGQGYTTSNQPDRFGIKPSTWHDQQNQQVSTEYPWNQGISPTNKVHRWQSGINIDQQSTTDRETDIKMRQWASRTNVLPDPKSKVDLETKNTTQYPNTNLYPNGIYVNVNGVKGHYITKEIEDNKGRSKIHPPHVASHQKPLSWNNTFDSTNRDYMPSFNITTMTPIIHTVTKSVTFGQPELSRKGRDFGNNTSGEEPRIFRETDDFNSSSVLVEEDNYWTGTATTNTENSELPELLEDVESDINADVDVLDDKNVWKPRLIFENKTETTTASSVIMRIGPKNIDLELFNIETAPFQKEEPPFPVYFVQPVEPLTHSRKSVRPTPISGQVIRLRGGSGPNNGYVEVQGVQPGWGTVCDSRNSWTLKKAHLLCKQLGYRGAEMAWQGRNNRNGMPAWIAANTVTCLGNETKFQSCKFTHEEECRVERDAIGVRCNPNRIAHCRKDEVPHEGYCYHLAEPDSGLNHVEALEHCTERNARLIDITSQAENNFVSEWLLQSHSEVSSVMTSGFGFTTMNHTLWLWGDSVHAKFKFTKWWPGWMNDTSQPPWVGSRPLCIVMKRKFPCHERPESICNTDYFFWDVKDCATSSKEHFFICKRPYDDIGCVYGKGNQYTGKANVTSSGKKCLPWIDDRIGYQLRMIVVNAEIREKLKMHNYCRNPNPAREARPWCFKEDGKREYCDIPACGNIDPKQSTVSGQCKPKHFECTPGECIPSPWVCDGEEDCTNGADEKNCIMDLSLFKKSAKHILDGYDVEKWLNTPLKSCASLCKEVSHFTCRSFSHKLEDNVCLLSDSNIGLTGALKPDKQFDYYEIRERTVDCDNMYICNNHKCINQTQVCDGKNDCNDRSDESICTVENLDYGIRLAGANNNYEGRIEVKILGYWGQVCDDGFGMINADVICKELGFIHGALEVRPGGFYGNLDPPTRFMVDQLKCRGNETTLRECDFNGWGVHNCQPEEAVGIVCKIEVDTCQEGYWKCDNSSTCIPTPFICDEVADCPDRSDESPQHCDAPFELRLANGSNPMQGRVEVRHHGVWGTVCDDDFTNVTAAVICRSLGYGGIAIAKKDGFFGPGQGPIWLDEVFCHGNESQLYRCTHNHWGQHNCDHNEDAGVICSPGNINNTEMYWINNSELTERRIDELLPSHCGQRAKDFDDDEDLIFQKVVHGSIAPRGTYPWQASIRVRGHSRSNHWCGAIVISPLHVLTAAHCLEGYNKGTYFVRAGDYNTDIDEGTEAEANIEDYYVHEEFRKGHRMNNDIALVLLKGRGIPLGKDIMPICLPFENTEYSPGLNCTISGFGSVESGKTARDLRYGWVPLLDQSICQASYVYGEGAISEGMMCAGYLEEGIDTCEGDSGGPLACYHNGSFTLYGITSWGQHCGKANKPGVYVRVAHYRQWIDKKIRESLGGR